MKNRQHRAVRLSATILILLVTVTAAAAQSQDSPAPKVAQQSHAAIVDRPRPQIVYNVRSRDASEVLHAQSKMDGSLPVNPNMPISLQISRASSNAEAARPSEAIPVPNPITPRTHKQKPQNIERMAVPPGQAKPLIGNPGKGHGHGKHHD